MASKAVARKSASEVGEAFEYGDDVGAGFEDQTQDDVQIPFIGILQPMSPQVEVDGDGQLEGAVAGMLHNSVTNELYASNKGFLFVPSFTKQWFIEWVPRKKGGGFVGKHEVSSPLVRSAKDRSVTFGKFTTEDGNDLVQTFEVWGVLVNNEGDLQPVILSFSSTKIVPYKNWNTSIQLIQLKKRDGSGKYQPPLYSHSVRVTTVKQTNVHGTFYNFVLSPEKKEIRKSFIDPKGELFNTAKELLRMARSDEVRSADDSQRAGNADDCSEPGGGAADYDEEGNAVF